MPGNEDFSGAYLNPGLLIEEVQGPVLNAVGIAPTVLGIVGDTQRYRTNTEILQLSGTTAVGLAKTGVDASSIVVKDRFTGTTYVVTDDYVPAQAAGDDGDSGTLDDLTTIARAASGSEIASGSYVTVTYRYTDPDYFLAQRFTDYDDVRDVYGDPLDSNGNINSELSLMALLAFLNGAREVYCVAVAAESTTPTDEEWGNALAILRNELPVNVVVVGTGSSSVHSLVKQHVDTMYGLGQYRRGFVGYAAGTSGATIRSGAASYNSERMVVVGPDKFHFFHGDTGTMVELGGHFLAAAVAGRHAAELPHIPLTHKTLSGIAKVPDQPTEATMIDYQRSGVMWVYQRRNTQVIVRHGVTTSVTNLYTRELSVQAAKDRMMQLILDTLEAQQLIGSVITTETPGFVVGAIVTALEDAANMRLIHSYGAVKFRQPSSNPTVVQVRFTYKPSLPLNSIQVQFAIDTNTGSTEFTEVA